MQEEVARMASDLIYEWASYSDNGKSGFALAAQ